MESDLFHLLEMRLVAAFSLNKYSGNMFLIAAHNHAADQGTHIPNQLAAIAVCSSAVQLADELEP
jgi:Cdc6-like AAA superfamily ATPase